MGSFNLCTTLKILGVTFEYSIQDLKIWLCGLEYIFLIASSDALKWVRLVLWQVISDYRQHWFGKGEKNWNEVGKKRATL